MAALVPEYWSKAFPAPSIRELMEATTEHQTDVEMQLNSRACKIKEWHLDIKDVMLAKSRNHKSQYS